MNESETFQALTANLGLSTQKALSALLDATIVAGMCGYIVQTAHAGDYLLTATSHGYTLTRE
jgi:hypothetical protein